MIGLFDSGIGGLTVLKQFLSDIGSQLGLDRYDYIYLGDNARAPYGNRSFEVIRGYTCEAVDFLFSRGCRLIIVACNTVSCRALRCIQQEYLPGRYPGRNVLGVVRPLAEAAACDPNIIRVGVLGTRATITSNIYLEELRTLRPEVAVIQQAAPLLVPLVEEGWVDKPEATMILKRYLRPLKSAGVQALILACTHYPFFLEKIRRRMPKRCIIPDPGVIVAQSLADYLDRHPEYCIAPSAQPTVSFCTTDDPARFRELGEKFIGQPLKSVEHVILPMDQCNPTYMR